MSGEESSLLAIAVEIGLLTEEQARQVRERDGGEAAISLGFMDEGEWNLLVQLAAEREEARKRVAEGGLSREKLEWALETQRRSSRGSIPRLEELLGREEGLPERYEIEGEAGRGGMGVVYRAKDRTLGRSVALKVLNVADANGRVRFKREAHALAKLRHANLPAIYDFGECREGLYYAMEYVDGETMGAKIREGRIRMEEGVRIVAEVAGALHYAHGQGIVHRDVKPDNILIGKGGAVYVTDFGLAHEGPEGGRLTRTGAMLGTPAYMAPEQVSHRRGEIDARTDVYGLGATLYELLTRRPPFEGDPERILWSEPDPPRKARATIPRDLETICLKALEKEPGRRYGTAAEMEADLGRYLRGEPIEARPVSTWERLIRRIRRNRGLAAAVAGLAVAIAGGGALLGVQGWKARQRERAKEEEARRRQEEEREKREALLKLSARWAGIVELKNEMRQGRFDNLVEARRRLREAVAETGEYIRRRPREPQGYFVRAQGRLCSGDLRGAEEDAREALRHQADFAPGWNLLGMILISHCNVVGRPPGDPQEEWDRTRATGPRVEEAVAAFRRGAEATREEWHRWGLNFTRSDEVMSQLARALWMGYAERRFEESAHYIEECWNRFRSEEFAVWLGGFTRDFERRLKWFDLALQAAPGFVEALIERATTYAMIKQFKAALADCDRALALDPENLSAYLTRGAVRQDSGDPKGAIADFTRAIELDPGFPDAWHFRALAKRDRQDYEGAIEDLSEALRIRPSFAWAHNSLGAVRLRSGDARGSLEDFGRAIDLMPDCAEAYTNRGIAKHLLGDVRGALVDFDLSLYHDPRDLGTRAERARARERNGDVPGALEDANEVLRSDPANPLALETRARILEDSGDPRGAVRDWTALLQTPLDPESRLLALQNRASARLDLDDAEGALKDCDLALELLRDAPRALLLRGNARQRLGDNERALADYARLIELGREYVPEAHFNRGNLRFSLGDTPGAVADLEAVLRGAAPDSPLREKAERALERFRRRSP